ncbi:MAG: cryptochrome/photolyase family protein [Cellvibrionales bacterium TMED47]|nr:cryptochrome/photolyase family protein [Porticoccaceae bacterium]RPG83523.1 MAG: cryptochrome/photolyase family protein [Cellvibrionales bacterium TMED47]|tara:strand:+ start:16368 stop:17921 length:1554 start_codon:yes stop_codon:yes gene_type:complete
MSSFKTLRLILGDQLNHNHSWYSTQDPSVLYVLAELHQETNYVRHHIQKICGFFAAMAAFADHLKANGHQVLHLNLDETVEFSDLNGLINHLTNKYSIGTFEYQQPDEYRLSQQLQLLDLDSEISVSCHDSEHFLLTNEELKQYLNPKKHNRMESFYRKMRKRFHILMDGDEPMDGRWNFDSENRQKLKPADLEDIPEPLLFSNDISDLLDRIKRHNIKTIGNISSHLIWPVNRQQALELLDFFCTHCLPLFGRFQDAMTHQGKQRWSLYHARISFTLNSKILHPSEVVQAALDRFYSADSSIELAQIEGFVRQIIGWREYVRGVYWVNIPEYKDLNHLEATNPLPDYFWTGDTKMSCVKHAVEQSLDYAYAHHIQRLMVTGNFAMLAGIDPDQLDKWYLGIYIDAIEWVEMPNTRGMSQFADGGLIATKPYAASGSYINKMSDYCPKCDYKVKERASEDACPFNSLYWRFMMSHSGRFKNNPRTAMAYRSWDRMQPEIKQQILQRGDYCIENLEHL